MLKTSQVGMFTPLLVGIVLIVAAAMMPLPPDVKTTELERLRFQHATWWFWQRAVVHYQRKFDIWPSSLEELTTTFALPPAPSFLLGTAEVDRFKLSWLNLTAVDLEILSGGLQHPHVEIHDDRIEAVMGNGATLNQIDGVHRYESSPLASNLSLGNHNVVSTRDTYVNEASVALPITADRIRSITARMTTLIVNSQVVVEKIAPSPLQVDELNKLLTDINRQYNKLLAHMQSAPDGPSPYQSSSEY